VKGGHNQCRSLVKPGHLAGHEACILGVGGGAGEWEIQVW